MQCNARTKRTGVQCKAPAVRGSTKCRMHGGKSLAGIASPRFKTGRYSKQLPERLASRYNEAIRDPKLLELRDEIALVGTRLAELLERLDSGESAQRWQDAQKAYKEVQFAIATKDSGAFQGALAALGDALNAGLGDYAIWREIAELTEQRRKLAESEHKRLVTMQQMVTAEQAMVLLARVIDTVRKHVTDPSTLAAISAEFRAISTVDAGG